MLVLFNKNLIDRLEIYEYNRHIQPEFEHIGGKWDEKILKNEYLPDAGAVSDDDTILWRQCRRG
jgi:hypothetical protein